MIAFRVFALTALLTACVHRAAASDPFVLQNVVTETELENAGPMSAYDVILHTHPQFFRNRGRTSIRGRDQARAVVFLNDVEYGVIETLHNIPAGRLREIRFFPGTEAATKFGSAYHGGVIQLLSKVE
ncbi:MAG: hypothetical protein NVS4B3_11930 [Gemmatimonadaceae bacterium]